MTNINYISEVGALGRQNVLFNEITVIAKLYGEWVTKIYIPRIFKVKDATIKNSIKIQAKINYHLANENSFFNI